MKGLLRLIYSRMRTHIVNEDTYVVRTHIYVHCRRQGRAGATATASRCYICVLILRYMCSHTTTGGFTFFFFEEVCGEGGVWEFFLGGV